MSSKAFYKSLVEPKLFVKMQQWNRSIEVWTTTCIVTNFGKTTTQPCCSILINPSNPQLSGTSNFSYFPRGGPVPQTNVISSMHKDWQPLGYVSNWGGMEVGTGMLYSVSVVDGLVHQLGGHGLKAACAWKRLLAHSRNKDPCPIGNAVETSAGGEMGSDLSRHYNSIVHTTPPFFQHDEQPREKLHQCYQSALQLVTMDRSNSSRRSGGGGTSTSSYLRVATPLLGAGARGFPYDIAIQVAAQATTQWLMHHDDDNDNDDENNNNNNNESPPQTAADISLVFGVLEESTAEQLVQALQDEIANYS